MSGFLNKIKSYIGLETQGYDEYDDEEVIGDLYEAQDDYPVRDNLALEPMQRPIKRSGLKVVSHPNAGAYEVKVVEPRSFEESLEIVDNLRAKKAVILNLHLLDAEQSQRIVDFLSGATHAVDGHQQKIGDCVFLFTPNNVAISAETEKSRVIRDAFWNQPK